MKPEPRHPPHPQHPRLRWKPRFYPREIRLHGTAISHHADLASLREAVARRTKNEVYLITRIRPSTTNHTTCFTGSTTTVTSIASQAPPAAATAAVSAALSAPAAPPLDEPPKPTWIIYQYWAPRLPRYPRVSFQRIRIEGLPLGGNPLTPWTYILGTDGHLGEIAWVEDGYFTRDATLPRYEPTEPWIESAVPTELANNGRLLVWTPGMVLMPTVDDLTTVMSWLHNGLLSEMKIKAAGSLHSWTPVAMTTGIHIAPDNLKFLKRVGDEMPVVYKDASADRPYTLFVRGGSGNTLRELNKFAWQHGLAFPVLGGYDGQTLGGMFNTGTHGSVIKAPQLADAIVSIDFVLATGILLRIEAAQGITDRDLFLRHFKGARLIQNDEYFRAALINMGTMGVVRSYVLRFTPRFHLKEIRTESTLAEVRAKLAGGKIRALSSVDGPHTPAEMAILPIKSSDGTDGGFEHHPFPAYHLEFLLNLHSEKVVITSRHPLHVDTATDAKMGFQPPGRDLIHTLGRGPYFSRPAVKTWFQERFVCILVRAVDTIMAILPDMAPRLNDSAMDTLVDEAYVDRSFNVFNIGFGTNSIPALACTIFVPLEGDAYLRCLDAVLEQAKRFAGMGLYNTAPTAVRFVAKSTALLGLPEDSCGFEFIFTASTKYAQRVVDGYDKALRTAMRGNPPAVGKSGAQEQRASMENIDGEGGGGRAPKVKDEAHRVRVHWGQMMREPDHETVLGMYPDYRRWREIRDELDPNGTFLNEWQTRILPKV